MTVAKTPNTRRPSGSRSGSEWIWWPGGDYKRLRRWLAERGEAIQKVVPITLKAAAAGTDQDQHGYLVAVQERWVLYPLDDHWTAAFRVGLRGPEWYGFSEVRVFPADDHVAGGQWMGAVAGIRAKLPRRALGTALVRDIPFRQARKLLERDLRAHARTARSYLDGQPPYNALPPFLSSGLGYELQLTGRNLADRKRQTPRKPGQSRGRGRPAYPDRFYAGLARDYVAAFQRGDSRRPIQQLAEQRGVDGSKIKAQIRTARERGLLTAKGHGYPGGKLTKKAVNCLRAVKPK